jgi:hypothetical protein
VLYNVVTKGVGLRDCRKQAKEYVAGAIARINIVVHPTPNRILVASFGVLASKSRGGNVCNESEPEEDVTLARRGEWKETWMETRMVLSNKGEIYRRDKVSKCGSCVAAALTW